MPKTITSIIISIIIIGIAVSSYFFIKKAYLLRKELEYVNQQKNLVEEAHKDTEKKAEEMGTPEMIKNNRGK